MHHCIKSSGSRFLWDAALRREFPGVAFHDFESWAKTQDSKSLLQSA
jgi:hypothetical protein